MDEVENNIEECAQPPAGGEEDGIIGTTLSKKRGGRPIGSKNKKPRQPLTAEQRARVGPKRKLTAEEARKRNNESRKRSKKNRIAKLQAEIDKKNDEIAKMKALHAVEIENLKENFLK